MPLNERWSNWRKDRTSKGSGKAENNHSIDSTLGRSSSLRSVPATKNPSADTSHIPTPAIGVSVDSTEPAARVVSSDHQTTSSQTPTSTQHVEPKKLSSQDIAKCIWDEAYNRLKQSKPKLVSAYEIVLSHEPREDGSKSEGPFLGENLIEQADNDKSWLCIEQIVQDSLKNTKRIPRCDRSSAELWEEYSR